MNPVIGFVFGLIVTMGVVFVVLLYLRNPLQAILKDLCGTDERARFWTAFSNTVVFLVPLALALDHQPALNGTEPSVFVISGQIESAVMGLIVSVMAVGIVLSWHISRNKLSTAASGGDTSRSGSQVEAASI
jgi:hypothetical protein